MIVMDSCGWIEFFRSGPHSADYAVHFQDVQALLTPTLVMLEVYKLIKRECSEEAALAAVAALKQTQVIPLTESIALTAADLSLQHRLPLADAVVLATAEEHGATLITGDAHFQGLPGVTFVG